MAAVPLLIIVAGYLFVLGLPGITWSLFTQDSTGDTAVPGGLRHAIVGPLPGVVTSRRRVSTLHRRPGAAA